MVIRSTLPSSGTLICLVVTRSYPFSSSCRCQRKATSRCLACSSLLTTQVRSSTKTLWSKGSKLAFINYTEATSSSSTSLKTSAALAGSPARTLSDNSARTNLRKCNLARLNTRATTGYNVLPLFSVLVCEAHPSDHTKTSQLASTLFHRRILR